MLTFFRKFFSSTVGIVLTLAMVGLIALAFAAGDVATSGGFGGIGGGDRVATVGNQRISTAQLATVLTQNLDQQRQQTPELTMRAFIAEGGLQMSLNQLIDRTSIALFGAKYGIVAGKRLVDSELAKIPGLQGLDGKFSEATYRAMLAQRQLTDAAVRQDIAQTLIARETLRPAQYGAVIPGDVVMRYAQILKEHRSGTIAFLPASAFAPRTPPSDAALAAFYTTHRALFIRPEMRVIRYAIFGDNVVKNVPQPTDAEIAASYSANQAQYAASQSRRITQLIAPTQAAAQAIANEVSKGKTLEAAAAGAGLSTSSPGLLTQSALADQSSTQIAAAAFAGHKGALIGPVQDGLGWHLLRIDAIEDKPAKSLAQAHAEIAAKLAADKQRAALANITANLDDKLGQGYALTDAAKDLGLTLSSTPPITADGRIYGQPAATLPKQLAPLVRTAFSMDQTNQPQLAEIESGKTYVMYDVGQITPSAPAPLDQIKSQVTATMAEEEGITAARTAALKLLVEVRHGSNLDTAMKSLGVNLPAAKPISIGRDQLAAMGQQVPPALSMLFTMAPNTIKLVAAPNDQGWSVVQLKSIQPGVVPPGDPLLTNAANELGHLTGNEYAEEMGLAMRAEAGVTRNPAAIKAVAAQAVGGS